jgi:hypothetical protein
MGIMEATDFVGIRLTPDYHQKLAQLALKSSAQMGRRVSMGFLIQELIDERLQIEHLETRSAALFGASE